MIGKGILSSRSGGSVVVRVAVAIAIAIVVVRVMASWKLIVGVSGGHGGECLFVLVCLM